MSDGCGHQGSLFSSWGIGVPSRLSSFGGGGGSAPCSAGKMPLWDSKGEDESPTRDLGDVKRLLTQQPPNELSVNESEADGSDRSGNTPEV